MHDLGCAVSHKKHIIQLYLQGKLPSEIVRKKSHNVRNVSRYIRAFETVRMLMKKHPPSEIARFSDLSEKLCKEYLGLCDAIGKHENVAQNANMKVINL